MLCSNKAIHDRICIRQHMVSYYTSQAYRRQFTHRYCSDVASWNTSSGSSKTWLLLRYLLCTYAGWAGVLILENLQLLDTIWRQQMHRKIEPSIVLTYLCQAFHAYISPQSPEPRHIYSQVLQWCETFEQRIWHSCYLIVVKISAQAHQLGEWPVGKVWAWQCGMHARATHIFTTPVMPAKTLELSCVMPLPLSLTGPVHAAA